MDMKVKILSVGKDSTPHVQALQDVYQLRLRRWAELDWIILPPGRTAADQSQVITKALRPRDFVILLDERGRQLTNTGLLQHMEQWMSNGRQLVFVIGGAYGVDQTVRERADYIWSLSELVFPHELMRIILAEQLYRTFNLRDGGQYHHA